LIINYSNLKLVFCLFKWQISKSLKISLRIATQWFIFNQSFAILSEKSPSSEEANCSKRNEKCYEWKAWRFYSSCSQKLALPLLKLSTSLTTIKRKQLICLGWIEIMLLHRSIRNKMWVRFQSSKGCWEILRFLSKNYWGTLKSAVEHLYFT